jgi:cytochrome c oxidase subunit 2
MNVRRLWLAVLLLALTAMTAMTTTTAITSGSASEGQERRVIRISAERFAFTPSRITIDAGEEVELRLRSSDTSHGFRVVGLDASAALPKRGKGEATLTLRVDRPGRYVFECNRMCGAGHNFMRGELIVRERDASGAGR